MTTTHTLSLKVAGTIAAGIMPKFSVYVNGQLVAGNVAVTAGYWQGAWNTFTFTYQSDRPEDDIKIVYANDYYDAVAKQDRNFYLNSLTLDGKTLMAAVDDEATAHLGYQGGLTSAAFFNNGSMTISSSQFRDETPGTLQYLGIAYSGAEFSDDKMDEWDTATSFPTNDNIDYYASKGLNILRLPILWEQLQPVKDGPLDQAYLDEIHRVVDHAAARGITVVIDLHNFGQAYGDLVGSANLTNADFADFWGRLAGELKGDANVMLGLMNEPNVQTPAAWLQSANAAIAAIRAAGATQTILVPGSSWDGAYNWLSTGNAATVGTGVVDPLNNYAFEVHQYVDLNASGGTSSVVSADIGWQRLQAITHWAEARGAKLFLGEFGVGTDATSLQALDKMLDYMSRHTAAWLGGTYWAAGNNVYFSVDPVNGQDRPQMDILEKYAPLPATEPDPNGSYTSGNTTWYADGSIEVRVYAADHSLLRRTLTHANGAMEVTNYQITGTSYTTEQSAFAADGTLVHLVRTRDDGSKVFEKTVNLATDTIVSDQYGATGLLATRTIETPTATEQRIFGADGQTLVRSVTQHVDGTKDAAFYGLTGSYATELNHYDARGNLTVLTRLRADGTTQFHKTVDPATGRVVSDQFGDTGLLTTRTIAQGGETDYIVFKADGASWARRTLTHADGSRDAWSFGITGTSYATEHTRTNAAGKLTLLERTLADGRPVFVQATDGAGTVTTSQYNAGTLTNWTLARTDGSGQSRSFTGTGALATEIVTQASGARTVAVYGITGKPYAIERIAYDAGGHILTLTRTLGDGTLVLRTTNQATGDSVTEQFSGGVLATQTTTFANHDVRTINYGPDGVTVKQDTTAYADGSREVHIFGITGQIYQIEHLRYDTNGVLVELIRTLADGTFVLTTIVTPEGTITRIYDLDGFTVLSSNMVAADGTTTITSHAGRAMQEFVYAPDGALIAQTDARGATATTIAHASFTLGDIGRDLWLAGTADINGTGNNRANIIVGNAGHNVLDGGGGADTMRGGAGNDTYIVDRAADRVIEAVGGGHDVVLAGASYRLAAGQEVEELRAADETARTRLNLTGNEFANTLIGNAGRNVLNGGGGDDVLNGGGGQDVLVGGAGNDVLIGGAAADRFVFGPDDLTAGAVPMDRILDFSARHRDVIDLSAIDADATRAGNQAFRVMADGQGHGAASLWFSPAGDGATLVNLDVNGDGLADLLIHVTSAAPLTAADFIL